MSIPAAEEWKKIDPKGKVRVTLRMQWDSTIASFEVFMPLEFVTKCDPKELFRQHVTVNSPGGLWSAVVWVDEHRSGGSGELGMAEVIWPSLDSRAP